MSGLSLPTVTLEDWKITLQNKILTFFYQIKHIWHIYKINFSFFQAVSWPFGFKNQITKCTLNLGIFWYLSWSYSEMFFAPMLAWESFPGPGNNVYKNILGNALLPLKLFHIKLVNTRLIFSQVTQKGPINSFCFLKNL